MRKKIYVVFACLLTNILGLHAAAQSSSSYDRGFVDQSARSRFMPNLQQLAMKASVAHPAQLAQNLAFIRDHPELKYLPAQSIGYALLAMIGGQFHKVGSYERDLGALNSDGTKLASPESKEVREWDLATNKLVHTLYDEYAYWNPTVASACFSPDGTKLVVGFFGGNVKVWDAQTGELEFIRDMPEPRERDDVFAVAISPNNTKIAAGSEGGIIRVWDVARADPLYVISENVRTIYALAFSPDGTVLASGDNDTVKLWKAESGEPLHTLPVGTSYALAFNPDGTMFATGSSDNIVRLWNPFTGEHLATLSGHTDCVRSLAFSPDGMLLASGANDKSVKLWYPGAKKPLLHTLIGSKGEVTSLAFSHDGSKLVAYSEYGDVVEWELGYQKDLHRITDTQELTFLLHAAQDWLAGKAYDVDVSDPVYQSLVARFAYLQDKRLFTLHAGALADQERGGSRKREREAISGGSALIEEAGRVRTFGDDREQQPSSSSSLSTLADDAADEPDSLNEISDDLHELRL